MSWVAVVWSMIASVGLTLAAVYLMVWLKNREARAYLMFCALAVATAAMAGCELWIMGSETVGQMGSAIRWYHIPVGAAVVSLALFTRLYLRAGRAWLAWAVVVLRTAALALNFLVTPNLTYREITGLHRLSFLGRSVSIPVGVPDPLMLIAQLGTVTLAVFILDAAVAAWRRGDRRVALTVGGSALFFALVGVVHSALVVWGALRLPLMNSVFYSGLVLVMGYEATREMVRAGELTRNLGESETRYRNIFENALEGIYRTSMAGRIEFANPATAEILGYHSPEDLTGSVKDIAREIWYDPEERARLIAMVEKGGAVRRHECRFKRKDGTPIWISLSTRPFRGPDGRIAHFDGMITNIDERKRAELALAESEERYRALFESSPAGIIVVGADGRVKAANDMMARLYGYASADQLIGLYTPLFLAERDRERGAETMREVLRGNEEAERIYTAARRDGTEFTVAVTSALLREGDPSQGYLCLTRDITKSQQDELERVQLRLERNQLAQALTVDQISTSLAHEINQPLGAILNNAEAARSLLSQGPRRPEVLPEILEDIIADALRAGEIIRKVRKVLRKGEARFEPLSVNGLIEESLEILKNNLALNDVELRLDLSPDLAEVDGDRVRLQQVLINLVSNALHAMTDAPSKRLTIRTWKDGPGKVTVSVGDSGPGIRPDVIEKVFQPFFTTKKSGLGLGLSICRSIIEEHRGRAWCENGRGGGAVFSFSLTARPEGHRTKVQ